MNTDTLALITGLGGWAGMVLGILYVYNNEANMTLLDFAIVGTAPIVVVACIRFIFLTIILLLSFATSVYSAMLHSNVQIVSLGLFLVCLVSASIVYTVQKMDTLRAELNYTVQTDTEDAEATEDAEDAEATEDAEDVEATEDAEEADGTEDADGTEATEEADGTEATEEADATEDADGTEAAEEEDGTEATEEADGTEAAEDAEATKAAEGTESDESTTQKEQVLSSFLNVYKRLQGSVFVY